MLAVQRERRHGGRFKVFFFPLVLFAKKLFCKNVQFLRDHEQKIEKQFCKHQKAYFTFTSISNITCFSVYGAVYLSSVHGHENIAHFGNFCGLN